METHSGRTAALRHALVLVAVAAVWPAARAAAASIPPVPADAHFIQDYAGVIAEGVRAEIGRTQQRAFDDYDTPIMVVTIRAMADYGGADATIETLARQWFDAWQIGKRAPDGALINRGMLVLVSIDDRKARIELGAEWAHAADTRAAYIMQHVMVPAFKQRAFGPGIRDGVVNLASLAASGPEARTNAAPSVSLFDRVMASGEVTTSPLPTELALAVSALGLMLIFLGLAFPGQRKTLLLVGLVLIIGAWLFWLLLIVLAAKSGLDSRRSSGGSFGGGFSSGGGFNTGGFSGGGGASGSW